MMRGDGKSKFSASPSVFRYGIVAYTIYRWKYKIVGRNCQAIRKKTSIFERFELPY